MTTTAVRPDTWTHARLGGVATIAGALLMVLGAALWASTGADLDAALADGQMAAYLVDAAEHGTALRANLAAWIAGVVTLAVGGMALSRMDGDPAPAGAARTMFAVAAPTAVVAFVAWLALVRSAETLGVEVAEALGYIASRADWIATALIVGFGPLLLGVAAARTWAPRWLTLWGYAAGAAGLLTVVAMITDQLSTIGMPVVPIGLGWMIAAGIVALRRA